LTNRAVNGIINMSNKVLYRRSVMNVPLSVLKANPAKYFELANTTNIIVTRRGKAIGSIVGRQSAKVLAVEALIGSADFPSEYDNPDFDPDYELAREADYKSRGLSE
jgi:hypothetical protein